MQFDEILLHLGAFGLYQKRIYLLASLVAIPVAWNNVGTVFFAASMNHWCTIPVPNTMDCSINANNRNVTLCEHIKFLNIPSKDVRNQIQFEQCIRYNVSDINTQYDPSINASQYVYQQDVMRCDSGWEYDTSQYKSTIVSEFDLVCDRENLVGYSNSIYFAGFLIGALLCGTVADWIGRYPVFFICVCMTSLLGTASAFAQSFAAFATLRFFVALFNTGCFMMIFILGTEIIGQSRRAVAGILINLQFGVGIMILSALAYFIRDWRHLQLATSLPVLLCFLLVLILDESARWLITRGEYKKAEKIIRKAASVNGVTLPDELFDRSEKVTDEPVYRTYTLLDLFRTPLMAKKTLIIIFNWFVISMVYYGLSLSTAELGVNEYAACFLSGAVEIPAILSSWYIIQKWGRRTPHCVYMVGGGVACLITTMFPLGVIRTSVAMVGKFGLSGAFAIIYIYSGELYPTVVRSIGMGMSSMCARLSGVLSPIILIFGKYWAPIPLIIFGTSSVAAGLLILLLPETFNENLPETLQDGELFGKNSKFELLSCVRTNREQDNGIRINQNEEEQEINTDINA